MQIGFREVIARDQVTLPGSHLIQPGDAYLGGSTDKLFGDRVGDTGTEGNFEDQGYPNFSWTMRYEEKEPRYRSATTKNKVKLRPLRHAQVKLIYDDGRRKRWVPLSVDVYLQPIERWSYQSKFFNELFKDEPEAGRR